MFNASSARSNTVTGDSNERKLQPCKNSNVHGIWLNAQAPTATLLGNVLDPSGAAVDDALVHVENIGTALKREGKTTSNGRYLIPSLPIGTYSITITAPGFKSFSQTGITLE